MHVARPPTTNHPRTHATLSNITLGVSSVQLGTARDRKTELHTLRQHAWTEDHIKSNLEHHDTEDKYT